MRAFVLNGPRDARVEDVAPLDAAPGETVIDVQRVGVCGTDVEFFIGKMSYLQTGHARFPIRLGHEWAGRVAAVGDGVDPVWVGRRVTGDTMIGDGTCRRCRRGNQHVCPARREVGLSGCDGALAEQLAVPASSLHVLPDTVDMTVGALVEPAGSALRAARAAQTDDDDRILVVGPGTIGLLVAMFLRAANVEVHLLGITQHSLEFARSVGFDQAWSQADLPNVEFDAVVNASNDPSVPSFALEIVEPGGRLVYLGLSGAPSLVDAETMALKDVTAVGILSASPALAETIDVFARGLVDPRPLVSAIVPLDRVSDVLDGWRPDDAGPGPKIQVDPRAS